MPFLDKVNIKNTISFTAHRHANVGHTLRSQQFFTECSSQRRKLIPFYTHYIYILKGEIIFKKKKNFEL